MSDVLASLEIVRPNGIEALYEVDKTLGVRIVAEDNQTTMQRLSTVTALCLAVFLDNPDSIFERDFFDEERARLMKDVEVSRSLSLSGFTTIGQATVSGGIRELANDRRRQVKSNLMVLGQKEKRFFFCSDMSDIEHGRAIVDDFVQQRPKREKYLSAFERKFAKEQEKIAVKTPVPKAEDIDPSPKKQELKKAAPVKKKQPESVPKSTEPLPQKRKATQEDTQAFYNFIVGTADDAGSTFTDKDINEWIKERNVQGIKVEILLRAAVEKGYVSKKVLKAPTEDSDGLFLYTRN
jgi:hypothetical protein